MADIKVLYVDTDGLQREHSEASDSIKLASLKTANHELTDAKLGSLVGGGDASLLHAHDSIYFQESEFINARTGAGDAAKPVKTDAQGYLAQSFIDVATLNATLDHGTLGGLGDDDHVQYLKTDGTRALTGKQAYAVHPAFSDGKELVDKKYVDDKITAAQMAREWQDSADDRAITPPGAPGIGTRILIDGSMGVATGAFTGKENQVAEWSGSAWVFTVVTPGTYISIDDEPTVVYLFDGAGWNPKEFENTSASTGLVKVGNDIRIDSGAAGAGLGFASGVLSVNVGAGLEIASDTVKIADDGVKDSMIDFGLGAGQVSAADVPIADGGGFLLAQNVETALQELASQIAQNGVVYIAGTGGVTKGHAVYVTANNTVNEYTTITQSQRVVGVAAQTVAAGQEVTVLANDTTVASVLTGAVAGTPYYWNGTGLTTAIPNGNGAYVYELGVSKNATDLHVDIRFVKKNA